MIRQEPMYMKCLFSYFLNKITIYFYLKLDVDNFCIRGGIGSFGLCMIAKS